MGKARLRPGLQASPRTPRVSLTTGHRASLLPTSSHCPELRLPSSELSRTTPGPGRGQHRSTVVKARGLRLKSQSTEVCSVTWATWGTSLCTVSLQRRSEDKTRRYLKGTRSRAQYSGAWQRATTVLSHNKQVPVRGTLDDASFSHFPVCFTSMTLEITITSALTVSCLCFFLPLAQERD